MMTEQRWRKRGRHFDSVMTFESQDGKVAITMKALSELAAKAAAGKPETGPAPVLVDVIDIERMLMLSGYSRDTSQDA